MPQVSLLRPGFPPISSLTPTLTLLTLTIAYLLTPLSSPLWHTLPNLAYLQFPWRLLILLTPILALTLALLLNQLPLSDRTTTTLTLLLPLALTSLCYRLYRQPPDPTDDPTHLAHLFATHHGFPPTDEYTPTAADNDPLRSDNPSFWLLPLTGNPATNPNLPAPHTLPTAAELNPSLNTDDTPIPDTQTLSTPAPHHLILNLTQPSLLVLNLRAYPQWHVTITPKPSPSAQDPTAQDPAQHLTRTDGLLTLALPAGHSILTITWHRTLDEQLGLLLSAVSLLALAFTYRQPTP